MRLFDHVLCTVSACALVMVAAGPAFAGGGGTGGDDTPGLYDATTGAYLLRNDNSGGAADIVFTFGAGGGSTVPLAGNWNGTGGDGIGFYDTATGTFFLKNDNSAGAADFVVQFGPSSCPSDCDPLAGNWDGTGGDGIGYYDRTTGTFFLKNELTPGAADIVVQFGVGGAGTVGLSGDWNNNDTDSIGFFDTAASSFLLKDNATPGAADVIVNFGATPNTTNAPVNGDWNNDGTDYIGLYEESTATWRERNAFTGGTADQKFTYGGSNLGYQAIAGDWDAG